MERKELIMFNTRVGYETDEKTKELFYKYLEKDGYKFIVYKMYDNENSFEIEIEKLSNRKREYYATISVFDEKGYELAEHYYQEVRDENKDCQINIFGYFSRTAFDTIPNISFSTSITRTPPLQYQIFRYIRW